MCTCVGWLLCISSCFVSASSFAAHQRRCQRQRVRVVHPPAPVPVCSSSMIIRDLCAWKRYEMQDNEDRLILLLSCDCQDLGTPSYGPPSQPRLCRASCEGSRSLLHSHTLLVLPYSPPPNITRGTNASRVVQVDQLMHADSRCSSLQPGSV